MPDMKFGISYEAPENFMGKSSILCKKSYNNPFISS